MTKIRKIISYEKLDLEVKEAMLERYPDGWKNHIQKIAKGDGTYFYAVALDYGEFSYLIKMDVKIDSLSDLEKEEEDDDDIDDISQDDMNIEFDEEEDYDESE